MGIPATPLPSVSATISTCSLFCGALPVPYPSIPVCARFTWRIRKASRIARWIWDCPYGSGIFASSLNTVEGFFSESTFTFSGYFPWVVRNRYRSFSRPGITRPSFLVRPWKKFHCYTKYLKIKTNFYKRLDVVLGDIEKGELRMRLCRHRAAGVQNENDDRHFRAERLLRLLLSAFVSYICKYSNVRGNFKLLNRLNDVF